MPIPFLSSFFSSSSSSSTNTNTMTHPVQKTDQEWQAILSPGKFPHPIPAETAHFLPLPPRSSPSLTKNHAEQFRILRKKGTEAPFSGEYDQHFSSSDDGIYSCAGCAAPLYRSTHKFKSGCGWPAFFDALPGAIVRHEDRAFGMTRTEIVCAACGGHLGHVFKGEGYATPTDERHCVNSVSISFAKDGGLQRKQGKTDGEADK
jgi:peptide-methionine (R)-S-oxide reductase